MHDRDVGEKKDIPILEDKEGTYIHGENENLLRGRLPFRSPSVVGEEECASYGGMPLAQYNGIMAFLNSNEDKMPDYLDSATLSQKLNFRRAAQKFFIKDGLLMEKAHGKSENYRFVLIEGEVGRMWEKIHVDSGHASRHHIRDLFTTVFTYGGRSNGCIDMDSFSVRNSCMICRRMGTRASLALTKDDWCFVKLKVKRVEDNLIECDTMRLRARVSGVSRGIVKSHNKRTGRLASECKNEAGFGYSIARERYTVIQKYISNKVFPETYNFNEKQTLIKQSSEFDVDPSDPRILLWAKEPGFPLLVCEEEANSIAMHAHKMLAHLSSYKVHRILARTLMWKGMQRDLRFASHGCLECKKRGPSGCCKTPPIDLAVAELGVNVTFPEEGGPRILQLDYGNVDYEAVAEYSKNFSNYVENRSSTIVKQEIAEDLEEIGYEADFKDISLERKSENIEDEVDSKITPKIFESSITSHEVDKNVVPENIMPTKATRKRNRKSIIDDIPVEPYLEEAKKFKMNNIGAIKKETDAKGLKKKKLNSKEIKKNSPIKTDLAPSISNTDVDVPTISDPPTAEAVVVESGEIVKGMGTGSYATGKENKESALSAPLPALKPAMVESPAFAKALYGNVNIPFGKKSIETEKDIKKSNVSKAKTSSRKTDKKTRESQKQSPDLRNVAHLTEEKMETPNQVIKSELIETEIGTTSVHHTITTPAIGDDLIVSPMESTVITDSTMKDTCDSSSSPTKVPEPEKENSKANLALMEEEPISSFVNNEDTETYNTSSDDDSTIPMFTAFYVPTSVGRIMCPPGYVPCTPSTARVLRKYSMDTSSCLMRVVASMVHESVGEVGNMNMSMDQSIIENPEKKPRFNFVSTAVGDIQIPTGYVCSGYTIDEKLEGDHLNMEVELTLLKSSP